MPAAPPLPTPPSSMTTVAEHTCTVTLTRFEPPVKRRSIPSTSELARLHVPVYNTVNKEAVDETPGRTDSSFKSVQSIWRR